jgi:CheY-like chemotaxis protein
VEPKQLLVVEDDHAVQSALKELFEREGYEVLIANNGVEAIELLERGVRPCCVLVDLLMPGIIGNELLDYLQSEQRTELHVAIITGSPHLAPADYPLFEKPLQLPALLDFVTGHCPM